MGLDQYLYAKKYISKADWNKAEENEAYDAISEAVVPASVRSLARDTMDFQSMEVSIKVAQWRKANQVHNWFVENVQDNEDDCKEYYVDREQLQELLDICKSVLTDRDLHTSEDILPTTAGFFYGSTDYDEWYYKDVEYTAMVLEKLLTDPYLSNSHWSFYYNSSW